MPVIAATIASFDQTNHQAAILPLEYPSGLWPAVPISASVDGELMAVGTIVAVQTWDDGRAVILGTYGGRPTLPPMNYVHVAGNYLQSAATWTDITNVTMTIAHLVTSWLWIHFDCLYLCAAAVLTRQAYYRILVDGVEVKPRALIGAPLASLQGHATITTRTGISYAAGTRTIKMQQYVNNAANVTSWECTLTAWAWPA